MFSLWLCGCPAVTQVSTHNQNMYVKLIGDSKVAIDADVRECGCVLCVLCVSSVMNWQPVKVAFCCISADI